MRTRITLTALLTAVAMMLLPGAASGAVNENIQIPLEGLEFPDFCGDGDSLVHTAGNLHIMTSMTVNDNRVSGTIHAQPQGAKLVDDFGRTYSGTGVFQSTFSEPVDGKGAATFTAVDSFKIIGHGSAPNFLVQAVVHMTVNANGDVTADVGFESVECKLV